MIIIYPLSFVKTRHGSLFLPVALKILDNPVPFAKMKTKCSSNEILETDRTAYEML